LPAIQRQARAKLSEEAKLQHTPQNPANMEYQGLGAAYAGYLSN